MDAQRLEEEEERRNEERIRNMIFAACHSAYFLAKFYFGVIFAYSSNFVPDEFWQSTEVAYAITHGKGHLTWEWMTGLRHFLIPAIIHSMYGFAKSYPSLDSPLFLTVAPQVLQGLLSLLSIYLYFHFAVRRMGTKVGNLAYLLLLMNWFTSYTFARTITNQTELSLNIICLWYLEKRNIFFMIFLMINFFIRPTAAVFWIPFIPEVLTRFRIRDLITGCIIALSVSASAVSLDYFFYGRIVITPWEFFKFNVLTGGSEEFGVHPFLWYFYSALPSIMGPFALLLPLGFFLPGETRKLTFQTFFFIGVFSCIGHKEIRFLLPILPLAFLVASSVTVEIYRRCKRSVAIESVDTVRTCAKTALCFFGMANIVVAVFLGLCHQRGFRAISSRLYDDINKFRGDNPEIWVIAPCYSMPVHTYLHTPRANYVYYICPPKRFEHFYNSQEIHSDYLIQSHSFEEENLLYDINFKLGGRGPPDWIITHPEYGHVILMTIFRDTNASYIPKDQAQHTFVGDFHRRVIVFQRAPTPPWHTYHTYH